MRLAKSLTFVAATIVTSTWLVGPGASPAQAQIVRWRQVIGIIEKGNPVGVGAGQVTGGGQPWSTTRGEAQVNLGTGHLTFRVQGLVLAGGAGGAVVIGTPGPVTKVKGTLVCNVTGPGDSVLVDTPGADGVLGLPDAEHGARRIGDHGHPA